MHYAPPGPNFWLTLSNVSNNGGFHYGESTTYLLVMGMSRVNYYMSHFLFGLLKMLFVMLLLTLPICFIVKPMVAGMLVLLIFLYVLYCVAFALFCATIFKRAGVAMTLNILITLGLTCLTLFFSRDQLNMLESCLSALNPVAAFAYGIKDLQMAQRFGFFLAIQRFTYQFNLLHALLFQVLDLTVLIAITLLLQSASDGPGLATLWTWLKRKLKKKEEEDSSEQASVKLNTKDFEPVEGRTLKPDVEVDGLQKQWDHSNTFAVKNATFQAFPGEITALLGHNGAGKSTTFSCLTGYTRPTAGTITICEFKVPSQLSEARKHIGYCPQGNPLFDRLTCMDHLKLAARLRGAYEGAEECRETLVKVGLADAEDVLAKNLSGGMKRKLCVAMALVGESRVVLLDEPTAGMDPTARRQIGEILEKFKKERTIILTTHYMDEADTLSDRILIMVKGKVICSGSPEFLKSRFGTGFILTVTLHKDADIETVSKKVLELIQKYAPDAKFDGTPMSQFRVNIPHEQKDKFTEMFNAIEAQQAELTIDAFGLSLNTLEQVFITVGEKAEKRSSNEMAQKIAENATAIEKQDEEHCPQFFFQVCALLWRNLIYFYRHLWRALSPFAVLLVCFVFLWWNASRSGEKRERHHTVGDLPYSQFLTNSADELKEFVKKSLDECILKEVDYDREALKESQFDVPPISGGLFRIGNGSGVTLVTSPFLMNGQYRLVNIWSNLQFGNGKSSNIETSIASDKPAPKIDTGNPAASVLPSFVTIFVLSFGVAMLLNTVITERVKKFKHQLRLASTRGYTYWTAQYLTDLAYFLVLAMAIFACFVPTQGLNFVCTLPLFGMYLLYFTAATFANYVLSFLFASPTKASVFVLAFHTIIPIIIRLVDFSMVFLLFQGDTENIPFIYKLIFHVMSALLPALPLTKAQSHYGDVCGLGMSQEPEEDDVLSENSPLIAVAYLAFGSLFYLFLLVMIETNMLRKIQTKIHVARNRKHISPVENEDQDVNEERMRVSDKEKEMALVMKNMFKFYSKNKCALRDLTFGMAPNECFGLLGVNGAGKTTTFDILTNQIDYTSGEATIHGVNIARTPPIGYCPQFDALSGGLTGRETLILLGRLNGFQNVAERVNMVLECVMLEEKADCLADTYSGGQKRRLSIACCLMSGSKFLVLDEPTAGVDPATRRHIWDLLIAMRNQNKAILLTTHSMEECEALCTRIGFLRAGRLRGIGTSQHLKSRYGNSYILTLVVKEPGPETTKVVDEEVKNMFNVPSTDSSPEQAALSWTIPKTEGSKWSQMYEKVEKFVKEGNERTKEMITDFYLVQDSLEQVFTRLSNQVEHSEKEKSKEPVPEPPVQDDRDDS